jgi:hypothetical protein
MTSRQRRVWTIVFWIVVPATVLALDAWFYVSMDAWNYNLRQHGAATFRPIVLTFGAVFFPLSAGIFGQAIFDLWSARRSTRWRVAEGRVTGNSIEVGPANRGRARAQKFGPCFGCGKHTLRACRHHGGEPLDRLRPARSTRLRHDAAIG